MSVTLAVLAALTAGYALGRLQLLDRLDTWVWRQFTFGGAWVTSRPKQALLLAAHAVVRPAATLHAWRHRHDPPMPQPAPVRASISRDEETP